MAVACAYLAWLWPSYHQDFLIHFGPDWGNRIHDTGRGGFVIVSFAQGFLGLTWLTRATLLERRRSAQRQRARPMR